jgi:hypothetical protein
MLLGVALPACMPLIDADTYADDEAGPGSAETQEAWRWREREVPPHTWDDSAEEVFRARCKPCHGEDGKHKTKMGDLQRMPDLTDPVWQASRSDPEIRKIIADGSTRPGSRMVGFAGRLTPSEMDMLVPYIRRFNGK